MPAPSILEDVEKAPRQTSEVFNEMAVVYNMMLQTCIESGIHLAPGRLPKSFSTRSILPLTPLTLATPETTASMGIPMASDIAAAARILLTLYSPTNGE